MEEDRSGIPHTHVDIYLPTSFINAAPQRTLKLINTAASISGNTVYTLLGILKGKRAEKVAFFDVLVRWPSLHAAICGVGSAHAQV